MVNRLAILLIMLMPLVVVAQEDFDKYFTDGVFRFDYLLSGTSNSTKVIEVQQKKEPKWGGIHQLQSGEATLGNFRFSIKDKMSGKLLYQKGFSPLFQEWQTTAEAKQMERAFYQVLRFPFPKNKVVIEIENRNRDGRFQLLYSTVADPSNYFVEREMPAKNDIVLLNDAGDPAKNVDLAILAEGYTQAEMGKFIKDASRLLDSLFKVEPFASKKSKFNIYAIKSPSAESGTDIPGKNIYVNTLYNSHFYTFDVSRYLTTTDMKSVSDQAAAVPYDYLIVLVNSKEYGGGGFCNYLSVCTSDHQLAANVFIHEFGHEFAGLGDEYYNSEVAYEEYYNLKIEPWEPNLTTLVNFASKWQNSIAPNIPVPTPRTEQYNDKTGVFEGGGYVAKGVYSPMQDCRMKSNKPNYFCPVCQQAILAAIQRCCD